MKLDTRNVLLVLCVVWVCTLLPAVSAISAVIYGAQNCPEDNILTTISNVPDNVCYSFHGRVNGDLTPTSGRISCSAPTAEATWSASLYGVLSSEDDYTCSTSPIPQPGTGTLCVSLLAFSARVYCAPENGSVVLASAGGIEASFDRTLPFQLKIAPAGNITANRYLRLSYSQLGEILADGTPVPDDVVAAPAIFHSVPLTDIIIAAGVFIPPAIDTNTDDYAFVGYYGRLPQRYSIDFLTAYGVNLNFLAKRAFQIASYPVRFPGDAVDTDVCLRASTGAVGATTCTPFQVQEGTLKNTIALYNWTYSATAASWRIQYRLEVVGFTGVQVYFNGNPANRLPFSGQIQTISWASIDPFPVAVTYQVQQGFNRGDNTFGTAAVSASGSAADLRLNVDIPIASLAKPNGIRGYWLYDPDITFVGEEDPNYGASGASVVGAAVGVWLAVAALMASL